MTRTSARALLAVAWLFEATEAAARVRDGAWKPPDANTVAAPPNAAALANTKAKTKTVVRRKVKRPKRRALPVPPPPLLSPPSARPGEAKPPPVEVPAATPGPSDAPSNASESPAASGATEESGSDTEVETVEEETAFVRFDFSGFLDARSLLVARSLSGAALAPLLPTVSETRSYLQLNLQPHLRLGENRFGAAADATLILATAGLQHILLLNEVYLDSQVVGPLYVLAGRRRVVWGSGLAFNPTDLLNPPKNPLNIEQRTGAFFLPMVEATFGPVTLTALYSPELTTNPWSLPSRLDFRRGKFAGRVYSSAGGTDLNGVYYRDFDRGANAVGLSVSRFVTDTLEVHAEGLLHNQGRAPFPLPSLPQCGPIAGISGDGFSGTAVAGTRVEWPDQTFVSFEYIFNGEGLRPGEYRDWRTSLPCVEQLLEGVSLRQPNPVGQPFDLPLLLLRRHYAVALFQRAHLAQGAVWEDLSLALNVILGLEDGSALGQISAGYSFTGHASVRVSGVLWSLAGRGQFGLLPQRAALLVDVRLSF